MRELMKDQLHKEISWHLSLNLLFSSVRYVGNWHDFSEGVVSQKLNIHNAL